MAHLITIAGGGLAGLSAGIGLVGQGASVVLHEAGTYPRHRVCGEFISGVTDETLERLGILACFEGATRLETMAWFHKANRILTAKLPSRARGISRYRLDQRLRDQLVESGGIVNDHSRLLPDGREGTLWCAGRPKKTGVWTGLKSHFANLNLEADLEMHLGRGCYVGLCRIEAGLVNVCGLFPSDLAKRSGGALPSTLEACGLSQLATRLRQAEYRDGSRMGISSFHLGWQQGELPASCGDAAVMIPPFTGNGMSMAFEAALEAVACLAGYSAGRTSWTAACGTLAGRLGKRFGSRMRLACMLHPFLTHDSGQLVLSTAARARILPVSTIFGILR